MSLSLKHFLYVLTFASCVIEVVTQIRDFTPPPPGRHPVEANGKLYNVNYLPSKCKDPFILVHQEFSGGGIVIKNSRVLMQKYGPYLVDGNIEIAPSGCLVIMPGTELYYNPGYGIIVNGTLIARGSYLPDQRILMTKNPNASAAIGASSAWPDDARLVDGNTTRDGRLDLLYKGKWRGICTNYHNFTAIDLNVTCRHLGFVYGNFTYHSFARNETNYMLYEKPACTGNENSLFECPGKANIKYGPRICDGQQVIGFQCVGLRPDLAKDHWRGLEFFNSTHQIRGEGQNVFYKATLSFLEYLDISYAGLDIYRGDGHRHGHASISASPYVPIMNNITVTNGAYDGLNLTEIRGRIHIANSTISDNRGYGVFIQSAVGRTLINKTDVQYNWGDGIKMYLTNYTIHKFNRDYPSSQSFCRTSSSTDTAFPKILHEDLVNEVGEKPNGGYCEQSLTTRYGFMITLHVLIMERDPAVSGTMTVYDGNIGGRMLLSMPINNGSFPQSVTTKTSKMSIRFDYTVPRTPPEGVDPVKRCTSMRGCIRFLLEATTNKGPDIELRLYNASVSNNNGYGVNVQDVRSKVSVNSSVISSNGYGAGLRIYQGAAEIAVNNTIVERNMHCGINITYSGGYQLFNLTTVNENFGYGIITEYLRLNRTRFEIMQKIEVVKSHFTLNKWTAFRIGNYCLGGEYLFNQSYFGYNEHEAIEYLSCNISTKMNTNFSIAFSLFEGNKRHAVLISPVINTVGIFTNNTFRDHILGVLRFDNGYDFIENRWYNDFDVNYRIYENKFTNNSGKYVVNMRLSQASPFQKMQFKFNKVHDNMINNSFEYLNPRSSANAPIIISSGNIEVQRNFIYNPESVRDIATHLIDPSVIILANYNWWNTESHAIIYPRLFDQNDRYNLAELKYHPVLKDSWLYGHFDTSLDPEYRWTFARGTKIGGVLDGLFTTNSRIKKYKVDRDIFILKDSTLEILPGTTLEFEPSIGMVVHGRLIADGAKFGQPQTITFKLYEQSVVPIENRTIYERIRLVDGIDEKEGRLELNMTGEFGTVCNDGWTDQNSALVCQQLGLTYNPMYGTPQRMMFGVMQDILMSRVSCDKLDTDIFHCQAEKMGEFVCDHGKDVFIRCQSPTWSGVTIPAMPRFGSTFETQIRHLSIEKAGLLDFQERTFTPGLRIDYNFYSISFLTVRNCVSDGINIKYSHPYSRNLIEHVTVENNLGNGIITRSPFLELAHMTLTNNDQAGFMYDPMFTEYEALSVRNFIYRNRTVSITNHPSIQLGDQEMIFLTCPRSEGVEQNTYWVQVQTSTFFRVTVQVLDYNPLTNIEKVTFYDSPRSNVAGAKSWEIEGDLVDFPIISLGTFMTIKYTVTGVRTGRLALAVISSGYGKQYHSRIKVFNATIKHNERGIVTKHYNNPSNEKMEIFHRAKDEEISFNSILIEDSKMEAMFIPSLTKYHENFIPTFEEMTQPEKVGAITYSIIYSKFVNNQKGIHAEHNHVDFANNVWKWNVSYVEIVGCQSGGFEIELPRVNDLIERQYHEVTFTQGILHNNQKFAFGVHGYYAKVNITSNVFTDNNCLKGLVTISGMEKDLEFNFNRLQNNYGKYVVDLDLRSHSEYSEAVTGLFSYNFLTDNMNSFVAHGQGTTNTPTTFALGIKGVQNIIARRNVVKNTKLQYELVAGITSLSLENKLNVKENYWGTTDQYMIKKRIFDFDDWNNFAIAEYFPFLSIPDTNGDLSHGQEVNVDLDVNHLGGRIWQDLTIPRRSEPYVVFSDLTVMPNVKFTIQPGTELQFYPNVGILVLGQLIASGLSTSRIKFGPFVPQTNFQQPFANALTSPNLRFIGGKSENEGFLEFYNSTSKSWNLMCDTQLNEKTAEVVCRELGLETVNVDVRFTYLYDYFVYGKAMYFLKEFWGYSYYCKGDEDSMDLCMKRINYNIKSCIFASNYTFIRCGARNLPSPLDYWGNIRFAHPKYEEEIVPFIRDQDRSLLQYIDVDGAGMLHGEKVGAIQTTYISPIMNNINITRSVSNGMDIVAPRHNVDILKQNISGNLGYAINILILNGDSTTSMESSFIPLVTNTVPYNLYGLVDICRMEKEIILENRLILFYKYSQSAVDCVKIVRGLSSVGPKTVALRFLQFSLYNDDFYRNMIEIFDGKEITEDNMMTVLQANSSQSQIKKKYLSTGDTLTIHIHASPSYGFYGFIAEVVTVPLSGLTYPDDTYFHNIKNVIMKGNQDGALLYKNVGEITPSLIVDNCWIEGNGVGILNLTSPPIIDIGLQSTKIFNLQYTFISRNKGGTYISATTPSAATKLRANVTNNVFTFGSHGEVLNLTGHHYERFRLYENYFFNNTAGDYRDIIHVQNVVVNFTFNTVTNNTGHYIVRLYNTEKTEATQEYTKNLFVGNNATALYRSLIHVGSGNPKINHNYMVNEECDFEIVSNPVLTSANGLIGYNSPIDAKNNWWGSASTGYVNGKIWDKLDNSSLVAIDYMPIKINNQSLIYGKCAPGWIKNNERCYKFMGAALPYYDAIKYCQDNHGFMAEVKGRQEFFAYLLRLTMNVYDIKKRVWVYSQVTAGRCSAFQENYVVEEYDCYYVMHPFICEKDPYISPPDSSIYALVIGIAAGVFGFAVIIIIILAVLWWVKSKRRSKEKFERRSSMRSSMRGSTIRTRSTMSMLSEGHSKRRLDQLSLSSSKYMYDQKSLGASQISLSGVTEDETNTDPQEARRKLRQRAEISRGRREDDDSPRYDRYENRNGKTGGIIRGRDRNEDYGNDDRRREPNHHNNGGYKFSDESHMESDKDYDSEEDMTKRYTDDEEDADDRRNSFTPVKFNPRRDPRVEKELDSIQMNANGSVQFMQQDESGSIDMSNNARQLSRSVSSFSQHDSQPDSTTESGSQNSGMNYEMRNAPTPPLPLNIALNSPVKPQPRPVPVPRVRPLPSTQSYGSRENIMGSQEFRLNNLSQDECGTHGSRDKLDYVAGNDMYERNKAPSRENLNEFSPYKYELSRSREKLHSSKENMAGVGVGIDFLPRSNKLSYGDSGRDSPIHQSREKLIPPETNPSDNNKLRNDSFKRSRDDIYKPDLNEPNVNSSREKLYPYRGTAPGNDYMGRETPQNTDYNDGTGVDYLPRKVGTPTDRYGPTYPSKPQPQSTGYQPSANYSPNPAGHQPSYNDYQGRYQPNYNPPQQQSPSYYGGISDIKNVPCDIGVDYLPRNANNYGNSSRPKESMSRSRENLSRPQENLSRSRENLGRSREHLRSNNDFSPAMGERAYDREIMENSMDVSKPGQSKSIETEI